MNPEVHRFALATLGPGRILYGSDNPVFYMRGRRQYVGREYRNRTSFPFFFNQQREPPEVEAKYTLYMYEELAALHGPASNWAWTARPSRHSSTATPNGCWTWRWRRGKVLRRSDSFRRAEGPAVRPAQGNALGNVGIRR